MLREEEKQGTAPLIGCPTYRPASRGSEQPIQAGKRESRVPSCIYHSTRPLVSSAALCAAQVGSGAKLRGVSWGCCGDGQN